MRVTHGGIENPTLSKLTLQVLAHNLLAAGQDLVERHGGGIENDRVGRGFERRLGAIAVACVAHLHLLDQGRFGDAHGLVLAGGDLAEAAIAAHLGGGIEEDLDVGVGKTAVPMSRPSMTTPPRSPMARCWATIHSRTRG